MWMYLYLVLGVLFAHIIVYDEIRKLIQEKDFVVLIGVELLTIALGGILGVPLFIVYLYNKHRQNKKNHKLEEEALRKRPRMLNAGLFKLFLSKVGYLDRQYDEQLKFLNNVFESKEWYAFLIVFNYSALDYIELQKIRSFLHDNNYELLLLDIDQYLDNGDHHKKLDYVYSSLSNTNYSFRSSDHEISASALSLLLNLEIDGINKLIVFNRESPMGIYYKPVYEIKLVEGGDFSLDSTFKYISLKFPVYTPIVEFMSLIWSKSELREYQYLKVIASSIKESILLRYKSLDTKHFTNVLELVLMKKFTQKVMFSIKVPDEYKMKERQEVAKYCILNSVKNAKNKYPKFSIEEIEEIKRERVRQIFYVLSGDERNDFKARIFMKSSLLMLEYIGRNYADYTAIVIGYAKFIEREVNLSIVEGIRKYLGVEMPTYYSIYCDNGMKYKFKRGKFSVDYNKSDSSGNLLPPGLGQSFISLSLLEEKIFYNSEQVHFANDGILFSKIRNKCAHPELVSSALLDEAETLISKFFIQGYLEEIHFLKERLSS